MTRSKRRQRILDFMAEESPITGSALSSRLGVTRQVIVQEVMLLRAQGHRIIATPKGYILDESATPSGVTKLVAVRHSAKDTRDELYTMVDLGVTVVDVIVDHPVYGQITGQLSVESRRDTDEFLRTIDITRSGLLSSLTDGIHLHTVRAKDSETLAALEATLANKGYLLPEE